MSSDLTKIVAYMNLGYLIATGNDAVKAELVRRVVEGKHGEDATEEEREKFDAENVQDPYDQGRLS